MTAPKFTLNLDGTLKKRCQMQERGEDQPGLYSPRPSTSSTANPVSATPPSPASVSGTSSTGSSSSRSNTPSYIPTALKKHVDPASTVAEAVAAEEAAIGITDPDLGVILSAKSRLNGSSSPERAASASPTSPTGARGARSSVSPPQLDRGAGALPSSAGSAPALGRRTAAALTTLVEHQSARQPAAPATAPAPVGSSAGKSTPSAPPSLAATETTAGAVGGSAAVASGAAASSVPATVRSTRASVTSSASLPAASEGSGGGGVVSMHLEEAYILGRTFRQYVATTSRLTINGVTGNKGGGTFRQNPSQYASAMAACGDYVAVGDRTGHVAVMKRRPMTAAQRRGLLEEEKREESKWLSPSAPESGAAAPAESSAPRTRDLYEFHVGQQVYTSVIDPLNSVEVTPNVSALAFLPQVSPAAYLLTANERVPKLYKVITVRESATPFRAVDKIASKTIGPLTAASRTSTVAMKPVTRYALSHEYNIHSICPFTDSEQFVTADDLTMQLWCTDYPDTSIETFDIRPPYDEEPREAIRCVRTFPHEPFLLFAVTSAGNVRVIDVRQALRWGSQTSQLFVNPPRASDGSFSNVTNSLGDCALSPCGRYIAGRDFMTVCLWDVRLAGRAASGSPNRRVHAASPSSTGTEDYSIVQRWELHPGLRSHLETLYQSDLLFERFDMQFINHRQVCTGGFGNSLYSIDVTQTEGAMNQQAQKLEDAAATMPSAGVQVFGLPSHEGVADIVRATLRAKPAGAGPEPGSGATTAESEKSKTAGANTLELGSRITLLSRPTMSLGGTCGFLLCCGQVVMQLSYKS